MNKILNSLLFVFVLSLFAPAMQAQDNRTMTTKIADLLGQMPSNTLQQRDKLAEELLALGEEGFQQMADKMTPSGKGDNTAVVFAFNGLTRYASQPGKEAARAQAETRFVHALEKAADPEVKAFFMRQLKLTGKDKSAIAVAPYLLNNELCEPASFVLSSINSDAAKNELLKAFPKAEGNCLSTITLALGELKVAGANSGILKNITAENPNLRKVSLAAVASIGSAETYQPLFAAAQKSGFVYEPSNATSAFVSYAKRLGETGNLPLCAKACEELIKLCQSPVQLHTNSSALSIYTQYFEKEAQPKLLKAFDNNDKAYRFAVLNLVGKSQLASSKLWAAKGEKAQPEQKAEIITMLGKKGDPSVADFIKKQFGNKEAIVSEAAIESYAKLIGKGAIADLTALLSKGIQPTYTATALMSLVDEKGLDPIAAALEGAPEKSKGEIITIIGAKSGKRYFDQIYKYTESANPAIKSAAYRAMQNTGTPEKINHLLKLLFATDEKEKVRDIQDALVNASVDIKGENEQAAPLLAQLGSSDKKGRILEVLPRLGGKQALKAVTGFISSTNQEERDAAFNALINWKDHSASAALYEICKTLTGEKLSLAINGFVRQIRNSPLPDDQKLLQYRKIMTYALETKDKELVIKSFGQVKTFLSLVTTASFLENPDLKEEAASSVMAIALPSQGKKGLSGITVRDALNRALKSLTGSESDYDRAKILKYLDEMTYEDGFVPMFNGKISQDGRRW